jgi:hypothetical protein
MQEAPTIKNGETPSVPLAELVDARHCLRPLA